MKNNRKTSQCNQNGLMEKYIMQSKILKKKGLDLKISISWQSICIPMAALIILAALIACSPHIPCNSYSICHKQKSVTLLCKCDCNKNEQDRDSLSATQVSADVTIQPSSECIGPTIQDSDAEVTTKHTDGTSSDVVSWPMIFLWISLAAILLLTVIFMLKYLVPYWTRIAEINERQNGKIIRLMEENQEFAQLAKRSQIAILVKQANTAIEEEAKDGESRRNIERLKQEYQSHLADVALEMIRTVNKSKEKTK